MALQRFISSHREEVLTRCARKVGEAQPERAALGDAMKGLRHFMGELEFALRQPAFSVAARSPSAAESGRVMYGRGWTLQQVVHQYGSVCQAITDLALELHEPIDVADFRTLNGCLDEAIASAVTEYSSAREAALEEEAAREVGQRIGFMAHELRNEIQTATLALAAVRAGHVGLGGMFGRVLDQSLLGMRSLIDRSLAEVRLASGAPPHLESVNLAELFAEIGLVARLEAQTRGCRFEIGDLDPRLAVHADRELLYSALRNLVQNALKFTHAGTAAALHTTTAGERVSIEVSDHCGGLPPGAQERMFLPFEQAGLDRSGLGLGLAISRRCIEVSGGTLQVRDRPGIGCAFVIGLPRHAP